MKSFSAEDRARIIAKQKSSADDVYDLLIVGGGITGAGVARDAASRGMKVALIERADFAYGTSSRSTKLIHGGLRYLENLEFKLVFEALSERQTLFEIAPHLVHPLRFLLPVYDDSRVGMFKMGCGMWLYDLLACFRGGHHERLSSEEVAERAPFLKRDGLKGAYVYSDAYMDDDRMVLDTLRSANDMGAECVNYVSAEKPIVENEKIIGMQCRDVLDDSSWTIKAKHTISTVGPWTDEFGTKLFEDWQSLLKPSKGIHLTLTRDRFPVENAVVLSDDEKGRIIFAVPRNDMVIVGTTDTSYEGDPGEVRAEDDDVQYLNEMLNQYFPDGNLSLDDYVSSYAGVRPLVATGESSVGKTSREHTIMNDPRGVTFVAGGKYTTYRSMAEEIVDESLRYFNKQELARFKPSATRTPLNPHCDLETMQRSKHDLNEAAGRLGCSVEELTFAWSRFGEEAAQIRALEDSYWAAEASFAIQNTMCFSLTDFYTRRTPLFLGEHDHGLSQLNSVAEVFKSVLNWNDAELEAQKEQLARHISRELSWQPAK